MMVATAGPLRNLCSMSTETLFNTTPNTEDIYLFKGSQEFGRSSMCNAMDTSDVRLAAELNESSINKGTREGLSISPHVHVTRITGNGNVDLNHGGKHQSKNQSSSPVELEYSGVCTNSTLEGKSTPILESSSMQTFDRFRSNSFPNNTEADSSLPHISSSAEEVKHFSTCASHMKLSKEEVDGCSSSGLDKDILKDGSGDSGQHIETALGMPSNTENGGAPLGPSTLDTLTANLAAKEDTAPNYAGYISNKEMGNLKSETKEPESRLGSVQVDLPAAHARHASDSRCSLGILLLSDGDMSHNKPESLSSSSSLSHGMVKEAVEVHPSTGVVQPEGGLNHVHDEPYNFHEKWYEHSEDADFHSSTFSGPIAFSGSITYSGVITYSGPIPRSGSISHRSDSSTSTRSFAFPVLASDWNSSPVKMAQPDARFFRRRRRWNSYFCCKRPSTLFD